MAENSLQIIEPSSQLSRQQGFGPQTFQEALSFAMELAKSTLIPNEFRGKPENVLVAIQHGAELGLPPMQALNSICVINGKPSIYGPTALAVVKAHPAFEYIKETFDDATWTATCEIKRRGESPVIRTFSKEDAQRAGLWDERKTIKRRDGSGDIANPAPWFCYPKRMLMFRARGFAMNDCIPEALRGIITAEEAQDYPGQTIDATPATTATVTATIQATEEPTVGTEGGTEFFKAYKRHGWTADDAKKWLADNLQIGAPHNDKDSRAIPKSKFTQAMEWANSRSPLYDEATALFDTLGFTGEEGLAFVNQHKSDYVKIVAELKAELARRNAQEQ